MINKDTVKKILFEFWDNPLPALYLRDLKVPLDPKKIVVVRGPRRSGKSFYFYSLAKQLYEKGVPKNRVVYFNFEDDRLPVFKKEDFQDFLDSYFEIFPENKGQNLYFLLDEIQNIDGWESFARRLYEKEKIFVFVTGSSSKLLTKEIATAMRGRCLSYVLYPLSFKEFLRFKGETVGRNFLYSDQRFVIAKYLQEYLIWGRFPEVVLEQDLTLKKKTLQEYFQALMYQDLAEHYSLENTTLLEDMLKYQITNVNSHFSLNAYYKAISQNMTASLESVHTYNEKIGQSDYLSGLPLFSYSLKVQRVNAKKISLLDNGLRKVAALQFSHDLGKLAENVAGRFLVEQEDNKTFYWQGKHEVDFVVENAGKITAVNVCFGDEIAPRETDGLLEFSKQFPQAELLLLTKDQKKTVGKIKMVPLGEFLTP